LSDLLDTGALPEGYVFPAVSTAPVGVAAGILPANGSIVSLATYPTLTYLNNNLGYLTGPPFVSVGPASGFNIYSGSGSGQGLFTDSSVIGPYHILCGFTSASTGVDGAAISFSSDLVNWTNGQINAVAGTWCCGIAKLGATYYALVAGTTGESGQDYVYSSTNLTAWTQAYTYGGGAPIYGPSQMVSSASIVVALQGGCNNCIFYNGTQWCYDTNNIGGSAYQSLLNVLTTGEVGGVSLATGSGGAPYTFSAWKVGVGNTKTAINVIDNAFTGSMLCPTPPINAAANAITSFWNYKLSYVGTNYVALIFGVVYTSANFTNWTKRADMQFIAMENIGGTLYGIALTGGVNAYYSSPDGVNWTLYYTSAMNQGFAPSGFGARILEISPTLWAVCSSEENSIMGGGIVYGRNTSTVAFIYNPTTVPLVQQSFQTEDICVDMFNVNAFGTGILAGSLSLIPEFNPLYAAQLPNLTSTAGAGTSMFMKI